MSVTVEQEEQVEQEELIAEINDVNDSDNPENNNMENIAETEEEEDDGLDEAVGIKSTKDDEKAEAEKAEAEKAEAEKAEAEKAEAEKAEAEKKTGKTKDTEEEAANAESSKNNKDDKNDTSSDDEEDKRDAEIKKAKKKEEEANDRLNALLDKKLDLVNMSTNEKVNAIHEHRLKIYDGLIDAITNGVQADMLNTEKLNATIGHSLAGSIFIKQLERVDKREQDLLLRIRNARSTEYETYAKWVEDENHKTEDVLKSVKKSSTYNLKKQVDSIEKSKDEAEAETTMRKIKQQTKYGQVMTNVGNAIKTSAFIKFIKNVGSRFNGLLTDKQEQMLEDIEDQIKENVEESQKAEENAKSELQESQDALNDLNESMANLDNAENNVEAHEESEESTTDDVSIPENNEGNGLNKAAAAGVAAAVTAAVANEISEQNDKNEESFKDLVEKQEFPDINPDAHIEQPAEENEEEDYDGSTYSPEEIEEAENAKQTEAESAEQTEAESAEQTETNDGESKYTMDDVRDEYREKIVGANGSDGKFKITTGSLYRMLHITANEQDLEKRSVMVDNLKSMVGANIYERLVSMSDDKNISEDAVITSAGSKFKHESEFVKECVKSYLIDKQNASDKNGSSLFEHNCAEKEGKVIVGFDNAKITNDLIDCIKTLEQNPDVTFEHNINESLQNKQSAITLLKETMDKQREKQIAVEAQKEEQVEQPTI